MSSSILANPLVSRLSLYCMCIFAQLHARDSPLGLGRRIWRGLRRTARRGKTWRRLVAPCNSIFRSNFFAKLSHPAHLSRPDCTLHIAYNMAFRGTPRGGRGGGFGGGSRGGFTPRGGARFPVQASQRPKLTADRTRWHGSFFRTSRPGLRYARCSERLRRR